MSFVFKGVISLFAEFEDTILKFEAVNGATK
jgi:hypothetical protein